MVFRILFPWHGAMDLCLIVFKKRNLDLGCFVTAEFICSACVYFSVAWYLLIDRKNCQKQIKFWKLIWLNLRCYNKLINCLEEVQK